MQAAHPPAEPRGLLPGRVQSLVSQTARLRHHRFWLVPLLTAGLLVSSGLIGIALVRDSLKQHEAEELLTIARTNSRSLQFWIDEQELAVQSVAAEGQIRREIVAVLAAQGAAPETNDSRGIAAEDGRKSPAEQLRDFLLPLCRTRGFRGYFVFDQDRRVVAASEDEAVGTPVADRIQPYLERAERGETVVSSPFPSLTGIPDESGISRAGQPMSLSLCPVRNSEREIIAVLGMRIDPAAAFQRIFHSGRFGDSGEVIAFDRSGTLVSHAPDRNQPELGAPPNPVSAEDPTDGRAPADSAESPRPLVAEAMGHTAGTQLTPYLNRHGVPVVGAWAWLPRADLCVAVEADVSEAERPLMLLHRAAWGLLGILGLCTVAIGAAQMYFSRLQHEAIAALASARQFGQYTLEDKIAEGGMGTVYRAQHAILRRPTAIKLLRLDTQDAAVNAKRLLREVEIISSLRHPNTITIYDFGQTAQGHVYYAMEFLDGVNLADLVRDFGPQPEGRVVRILAQACGALAEAHAHGLIHRDIKPENIMLLDCGGWPDFVKVLDFGLAKALDEAPEQAVTQVAAIAGTPQYFAPERLTHPDEVDARSDLYSLAAVGYLLLTGTHVFTGKDAAAVLARHIREPPQAPSARLGRPVHWHLEELLLACLSKSPADRPVSAEEFRSRLFACELDVPWTDEDAGRWWREYRDLQPSRTGETVLMPSTSIGDLADSQRTAEPPGLRAEGQA